MYVEMKKTCKRHKGFTLLELMIAMGISSLLLLVLYYAYFLAQTFFYMGTDTIQEQTYVRNLFSKISEDLQFANRLNSLVYNSYEKGRQIRMGFEVWP